MLGLGECGAVLARRVLRCKWYEAVITIEWNAFISVLLFAGFFVAGLQLRRRSPESHKRLMLLAAVVLIGPATGRFEEFVMLWGGTWDSALGTALEAFGSTLQLLLPASVMLYDLIATRRVHPAGAAGFLVYYAFLVADDAGLAGPLSHALWNMLK